MVAAEDSDTAIVALFELTASLLAKLPVSLVNICAEVKPASWSGVSILKERKKRYSKHCFIATPRLHFLQYASSSNAAADPTLMF